MTVRELIIKLLECDLDRQVAVNAPDLVCDVDNVYDGKLSDTPVIINGR